MRSYLYHILIREKNENISDIIYSKFYKRLNFLKKSRYLFYEKNVILESNLDDYNQTSKDYIIILLYDEMILRKISSYLVRNLYEFKFGYSEIKIKKLEKKLVYV